MLDFYALKSIVASQKVSFPMKAPTESFCLAEKRTQPYIEPSFDKVEFQQEKPAILLVSAVAVTGKSTLAQVLSNHTGLPVLDLGKHKPVGADTLTGLLTNGYQVGDLSRLLEAISKGSYGVIIDGVDEGRSKTTEEAFDAFLDDLAQRCAGATHTSFVLLGRTQVLEHCWLYLTLKNVTTGLVTIRPFNLEEARQYIDAFTAGSDSSHPVEYANARDTILKMLSAAFGDRPAQGDQTFLSFVGYPPVLDAIATLLREEKNYYKMLADLECADSADLEIDLLYRVVSYILRREKQQKVLPNIVQPLIGGMSEEERGPIVENVFEAEEQCGRLVSHSLGRQLRLDRIPEPLINEKYEAQLLSWLHEHPFVDGRGLFRNAVFESFALATLIGSRDPQNLDLALEYADRHKYSYHTIYFLQRITGDGLVPVHSLRVVLGSALEFRSTATSIELHVEGARAQDAPPGPPQEGTIETRVEIIGENQDEPSKAFNFRSALDDGTAVLLGSRLSSTYVSLPCDVLLSGIKEVELTAPVEISATKITLQSPELVLRPARRPATGGQVVLEAEIIDSTVTNIVTNGVDLALAVQKTGLTFPAVKYVVQKDKLPEDSSLQEKYLRLRRILVHFRSHSRGSLAKYKEKIEHWRVLGNDTGWDVLERLKSDGILTLSGNFYFLQPESVHEHLGISYADLRKGRTSERLLQYLRSIK